jgi:hypothetical protein
MITLDEARSRIGDGVVYYSPGHRREDGTVTSVNDTYVFVRYAGDSHSKATHPRDLEFLS